MKGLLANIHNNCGIYIPTKNLDLDSEDIDLSYADVKMAYTWLCNFYAGEYTKLRQVFELLPPETWKRYLDWGDFDNHQECIAIRREAHTVRTLIQSNNRPNFFKRSFRAKELKAKSKKSRGVKSKADRNIE